MQKRGPSLLLAALLLVSCASEKNQVGSYEKAPLFGMIYDEDNQPCAGVRLTLDGAAVMGDTGPVTDIRGRFVLPELARGQHLLVARKDGYEELSVKITFLTRTDVLFLRMISLGQLLTNAEKALEERKWEEAQAFLTRAGKLDSGNSSLLFLQAVKAYRTAKYEEAVELLNGILGKGIREPSVYLFLADIYERKLNDQRKAIVSLQACLDRRADADVQKRLADLKAGR